MSPTRCEALHGDPAHWKLGGMLYFCREDPRVVVRSRVSVGWTWNFAHPRVVPAIALAAAVFLGPPLLAAQLGVRSSWAIGGLALLGLGALTVAASRLSRDPER